MRLQTPKGFRDFLPQDALKRKFVLDKIIKVFEKFGFEPLETPTLEFEETLLGKYGEEGDKLIYTFETFGGEDVALRYDQTVPLARVIAQYGPRGAQKLIFPFKRYQIQSAFRGENTQKGRYREFLQCDADIVGVSSPLSDAEILGLVYEIYKELGLKVIIKVSDRASIIGISPGHLLVIDKLSKIGEAGVIKELQKKGLTGKEAGELFKKVRSSQVSPNLKDIIRYYEMAGYPKGSLVFDPTLVRGLDYYTGVIFETVLESNPNSSSLCGGGRWDKMIGHFTGLDLPAVGFAIGFDRTLEALEEEGLIRPISSKTQAMVIFNSLQFADKALGVLSGLRESGINSEIWLEPSAKMEKQLKYTDIKGIPFAVIVGLQENEKPDEVILKNLHLRTQETVKINELALNINKNVIPAHAGI